MSKPVQQVLVRPFVDPDPIDSSVESGVTNLQLPCCFGDVVLPSQGLQQGSSFARFKAQGRHAVQECRKFGQDGPVYFTTSRTISVKNKAKDPETTGEIHIDKKSKTLASTNAAIECSVSGLCQVARALNRSLVP